MSTQDRVASDIANNYNCSDGKTDETKAEYVYSGLVNGLTGLVYPAGDSLLDGPKQDLKNLNDQLTSTQKMWGEKVEKYKDQLTDQQSQIMDTEFKFIQATQDLNQEILEDKINEDTLLIQIIMGILLIIIIYLVFL